MTACCPPPAPLPCWSWWGVATHTTCRLCCELAMQKLGGWVGGAMNCKAGFLDLIVVVAWLVAGGLGLAMRDRAKGLLGRQAWGGPLFGPQPP